MDTVTDQIKYLKQAVEHTIEMNKNSNKGGMGRDTNGEGNNLFYCFVFYYLCK